MNDLDFYIKTLTTIQMKDEQLKAYSDFVNDVLGDKNFDIAYTNLGEKLDACEAYYSDLFKKQERKQ